MFSFLQMLLLHPHRYHHPPRPQEAPRRRRIRNQRRGWRRRRPAAPGAGQVSAPVTGVWRHCLSRAALGPSLLGVLGAGHPDSAGAKGPAHWPRRWVGKHQAQVCLLQSPAGLWASGFPGGGNVSLERPECLGLPSPARGSGLCGWRGPTPGVAAARGRGQEAAPSRWVLGQECL